MDPNRLDIATALAHASQTLHNQRTMAETLDAVVLTARDLLPGIDHVGISVMHKDGTFETRAATDGFVWQLDALQHGPGEGPCLDAMRGGRPVVAVENIRAVQQWPAFLPPAIEAGLRSMIGVRIYADARTIGGLNMYSVSSDTIDPDVPLIAELFAAHAATALGRSRTEADLNVALQSRRAIGQAIGMVMERYHVDEDNAFKFLTRVSQNNNIKLREVAQELIDQGNDTTRAADDPSNVAAPFIGSVEMSPPVP